MEIVLLLLTVFMGTGGIRRCFDCTDAPHPADCKVVTFCPDTDQCMTRQYVSSNGLILYHSGCESKYRCNKLFGKRHIEGRQKVVRATGDLMVCEECCDGDFCNINGCGVFTPKQPQRGPFCLNCLDENDPINCRHVIQCELEETCSVSQIFNHNADGIIRFQSGCIRDMQCSALALISKTQNICFECCLKDFCNDRCSSTTPHH